VETIFSQNYLEDISKNQNYPFISLKMAKLSMSTDTPNKNYYWSIYLVVFILLSTMAVLRYYSLHSTVYDMGLSINNFYMISEGYWERLFLSHIQPLGVFWSLFYKVLPTDSVPVLILVGQASLLTLPIIGLYRFYGLLPAIAFLLYFVKLIICSLRSSNFLL